MSTQNVNVWDLVLVLLPFIHKRLMFVKANIENNAFTPIMIPTFVLTFKFTTGRLSKNVFKSVMFPPCVGGAFVQSFQTYPTGAFSNCLVTPEPGNQSWVRFGYLEIMQPLLPSSPDVAYPWCREIRFIYFEGLCKIIGKDVSISGLMRSIRDSPKIVRFTVYWRSCICMMAAFGVTSIFL